MGGNVNASKSLRVGFGALVLMLVAGACGSTTASTRGNSTTLSTSGSSGGNNASAPTAAFCTKLVDAEKALTDLTGSPPKRTPDEVKSSAKKLAQTFRDLVSSAPAKVKASLEKLAADFERPVETGEPDLCRLPHH